MSFYSNVAFLLAERCEVVYCVTEYTPFVRKLHVLHYNELRES